MYRYRHSGQVPDSDNITLPRTAEKLYSLNPGVNKRGDREREEKVHRSSDGLTVLLVVLPVLPASLRLVCIKEKY